MIVTISRTGLDRLGSASSGRNEHFLRVFFENETKSCFARDFDRNCLLGSRLELCEKLLKVAIVLL